LVIAQCAQQAEDFALRTACLQPGDEAGRAALTGLGRVEVFANAGNVDVGLGGSVLQDFGTGDPVSGADLTFRWRPNQRNSVVVLAAMTVETSELSWPTVGLAMRSRSAAMALSAVLSSTTTASALVVSRFSVRIELYGCTTTSLVCDCDWLGKTEYVWMSFFGKWSFSCSSR
jgi:hypothetical protein